MNIHTETVLKKVRLEKGATKNPFHHICLNHSRNAQVGGSNPPISSKKSGLPMQVSHFLNTRGRGIVSY